MSTVLWPPPLGMNTKNYYLPARFCGFAFFPHLGRITILLSLCTEGLIVWVVPYASAAFVDFLGGVNLIDGLMGPSCT